MLLISISQREKQGLGRFLGHYQSIYFDRALDIASDVTKQSSSGSSGSSQEHAILVDDDDEVFTTPSASYPHLSSLLVDRGCHPKDQEDQETWSRLYVSEFTQYPHLLAI